ncbi:hypothetical protein KPL78_12220 [Roseomonas sp. HJA6]|uniref:Uncharacterized protein n=1 Tax=Roseomonas alba TaxID=2846776 RepID=A0ABS7A8K1_9PROT|nr:hypothetical protein [Neoroseomonas alba]MBW6398621.1 hypothetical protein [Neoroseomonas alba]
MAEAPDPARPRDGVSTSSRRDPRAFAASDIDFAALRDMPVAAVENAFTRGERRRAVFGGRRADFFDHMNELRSEFVGRSELLPLHAGFVVALRRKVAVAHFLPLYLRLWREECDFLRRELSLRWLVSACDTLVDFGETPTQRAVALNGTVLANLAKLAETERRRASVGERPRGPRGVELFDGMTVFKPGGDMIDNLFRRVARIAELDGVAGPILDEVALRLRRHDTVVRRLQAGPTEDTEADEGEAAP